VGITCIQFLRCFIILKDGPMSAALLLLYIGPSINAYSAFPFTFHLCSQYYHALFPIVNSPRR